MMVGMARPAESDQILRLVPKLRPALGIQDVMVVGRDPAAGYTVAA